MRCAVTTFSCVLESILVFFEIEWEVWMLSLMTLYCAHVARFMLLVHKHS